MPFAPTPLIIIGRNDDQGPICGNKGFGAKAYEYMLKMRLGARRNLVKN